MLVYCGGYLTSEKCLILRVGFKYILGPTRREGQNSIIVFENEIVVV